MSTNTLELSNIAYAEDIKEARLNGMLTVVHGVIDPVINRLASLNPLWTFTAFRIARKSSNEHCVDGFKVRLDSEELGTITKSYMGGKGDVIAITNDRIGKVRSRSSSYRTADADKAIVMAKKMFGKMSPVERINKAKDIAESIVTSASWTKQRECDNDSRVVNKELEKWANTKGYAMFMEYIDKEAALDVRNAVIQSKDRLATLKVEMQTIERVQSDFGDGKTALIVKDAGKYLVKIGDKINLYSDGDLPTDIRMKLGMLKLVEDTQYLTDIGCRVTSEIFVLLIDDLTNVSEGE